MTLIAIAGSLRPFQSGHAVGKTASGPTHREPVDWLIDTGADWSAVLPKVAQNFVTTTPVNATTGPPSGAAYRLAAGIEIEFTIMTSTGPQTVASPTPVIAIKRRNQGSNLIGVPELAAENVEVRWHARNQTGELRR